MVYMASKDKYTSIADQFGMSESTANTAVRNLLDLVATQLLNKVICCPAADEQLEIQSMYMDLCKSNILAAPFSS